MNYLLTFKLIYSIIILMRHKCANNWSPTQQLMSRVTLRSKHSLLWQLTQQMDETDNNSPIYVSITITYHFKNQNQQS